MLISHLIGKGEYKAIKQEGMTVDCNGRVILYTPLLEDCVRASGRPRNAVEVWHGDVVRVECLSWWLGLG